MHVQMRCVPRRAYGRQYTLPTGVRSWVRCTRTFAGVACGQKGGLKADRVVGETAVRPYVDVLGAEESARLAQSIRRGDRAAEASLARLYCDCVFSMALVRTRDRDAARELMDDVLMAVIVALRRGALRDSTRLGGFVHGTATNTINSYVRKQRHRLRTVALDPDLPVRDSRDDYDAQDRQRVASRAMALLHERDRQILYLGIAQGLKPGEIAARLGLSPALVRQRKCRALRALVAFVGDGPTTVRPWRTLRK